MKLILFINILFVVISGICSAQVFQPDGQAKGYLDSKNTTVDYVTGIFNYNIPILNLAVQNYNIPITLSYSGHGVKPGDLNGIIGKNWSLLVAGVITKTVRAGNKKSTEVDYYSLAIKGNVLHFLLQDEKVIPLEKTNLKIQYIKSKDSWIVTDEGGVKYFFDVREITKNGCKEEAVSLNNTDNLEYTSSWYPSKIDIPNGSPIIFKYSVSYNRNNARFIDSTSYMVGVENRYYYGRPMVERPFAFHRFRSSFNEYLDRAYNAARDRYLEMEFQISIQRLAAYSSDPFSRASFDNAVEYLNLQRQVMGVVTDLRDVSNLSCELFGLLDLLISFYGVNSRPSNFLEQAKNVLISAVNQTINIYENEYPAYTMYTIMPVYLEKIEVGGQVVNFQYDKRSSWASCYRTLNSITLYDDKLQKVQEIRLSNQNGLLKKIAWIDKNNIEIKHGEFIYFIENEDFRDSWNGIYKETDYLGFFSKNDSSPQDSMLSKLPDENYAKAHSLREIITPEGGKIEIDYELNRFGGTGNNNVYGGIRLKQLVLRNNEGSLDSIKYHYNASARLLYNKFVTYEWVKYNSGVEDLVIKSKAKFIGTVYVNSGNNGLLYDYVTEEIKGKGYNSYLFSVPQSSSHQLDNTYPFWLCGLPLAKAVYNKDGNLVMMQKMKYYTTMSLCNVNVSAEDWFCQGETVFDYTQGKRQRVLSEYLIIDEARNEYKSYDKTLIYSNPRGESIYYDPMEAYANNVRPRTGRVDGSNSYYMYLGGKTLMKEQITYQYAGNISNTPSRSHLTGGLLPGYYITNKTEFIYDTLNVRPIGIKTIQSNGNEILTLKKNALCFAPGVNASIDNMRDSNNLVTIKELELLQKSGESNFTLLTEKVVGYKDSLLPGGERVFMPRGSYSYKKGDVIIQESKLNSLEQSLFSADLSDYKMDTQFEYRLINGKYFVSDKIVLETKTSYCYAKERNHCILDAKNINSEYVAGTDTYRWGVVNQELISRVHVLNSELHELQQFISLLDEYYEKEIDYYGIRYDEELIQFLRSPLFYRIGDFLEMMNSYQEHFDIVDNLADSVRTHSIAKLRLMIRKYPQLNVFSPMISPLRKLCLITRDEYDLLNKAIEGVLETEELQVNVNNQHQLFVVTVLLKPILSTFLLNYKIMKGSTAFQRNISFQNLIPGRWQLASFSVNTGEVNGATALNVLVPLTEQEISLVTVVPQNVIYDAMSYNADGSILCKFNQKGEMQLFEYDSANRLARIKNQDGDVLIEYNYNFPESN